MEPSGCSCHLLPLMAFAHLQGALLTSRVRARARLPVLLRAVWLLGFKQASQNKVPQAILLFKLAQMQGGLVLTWGS